VVRYALTAAPPSTKGDSPVSAATILDGGGWFSFLVAAVVSLVGSIVVLSPYCIRMDRWLMGVSVLITWIHIVYDVRIMSELFSVRLTGVLILLWFSDSNPYLLMYVGFKANWFISTMT